jgi:hypothetical protein
MTDEHFYINLDEKFYHRVNKIFQLRLPLNTQWKADLFQIIDKFRNSVISNLFNNPILNKIYRHIIKKIKDIVAVGDTSIIIQKLFRLNLENKLLY